MTLTSTLGSPGIEIREIDNSYRINTSTQSTVFVPGFAPQGPIDEIMHVGTLSDFEIIFGTPTNAAERYFYYTVKALLDNNSTVLCSRLPYGKDDTDDKLGNSYDVLAYPAIPVVKTTSGGTTSYTVGESFTLDKTDEQITYVIGAPTSHNISLKEYYQIISGDEFEWADYTTTSSQTENSVLDAIKNSAFIIINTARTTINSSFEGFYIGLTDNLLSSPRDGYTKFNSITDIKVPTVQSDDSNDNVNSLISLAESRCAFKYSDGSNGAISTVMENVTSMDISSTEYDDTLSLVLFKLNKSVGTQGSAKLNYSIREKYNWSIDRGRMKTSSQATKPVSYFVEHVVENSPNLMIIVNPYISNNTFTDTDGKAKGKVRIYGEKLKTICSEETISNKDLEQIGFDKNMYGSLTSTDLSELNYLVPFGHLSTLENNNSKKIGNVPEKLKRVLELIENDEQYPDIDILVEAGLGTIYTYAKNNEGNNSFDETANMDFDALRTSNIESSTNEIVQNYKLVHDTFTTFANSMQNGGRGDTFYIADVPRGVLLKGKNTKITSLFGQPMTNEINHSFTTSVYFPIKNIFDGIVSSYMSTYAQWVKILDNFSGDKVWIPISGYIAANMASTDTVYGPWYATAGLRRGVINNVLDYAISPNHTQRTDLYKICINSVPKIPNYGVTIWGIRTMSKTESAFDQNTCRRTFLYMEKKIKQLMRYYIFEPNTSYTRLQIFNDLDPFLEGIKNNGGIYSYKLVCDTTNNTPEIINNGDLAVSIAAAPTRTAENIIIEFTANKYSEEISSSESIG